MADLHRHRRSMPNYAGAHIRALALVLALLAPPTGCGTESASRQGFRVDVELTGLDSGTAKLMRLDLVTNEPILVDSTTISSGRFAFEGEVGHPYVHSILISELEEGIHFFLEDSEILIRGEANNLAQIAVTGSREDSVFRSYDMDAMFEEETGREIMSRYPSYAFSAFIAYYQFQIHNYSVESMESILESLAEPVRETIYFAHLEKLYETIKRVAISQPAPLFQLPNVDNDLIQLADFRGRYVLLDFWASWCAPCREENPHLVQLYDRFRGDDFEILGISVDTDREKWIEAIEADEMEWPQLSNLKGRDEVSTMYGVKAVPQNFLLDPEGVIIGKNLELTALAAELDLRYVVRR